MNDTQSVARQRGVGGGTGGGGTPNQNYGSQRPGNQWGQYNNGYNGPPPNNYNSYSGGGNNYPMNNQMGGGGGVKRETCD